MNFLLKVAVNAAALWLTASVYGGVSFVGGGPWEALFAGLVLGLVNALIRPLLLLLSAPINLLTLGLFTLVVNGAVLALVAALTSLQVASFGAAVIGALILALISWALDALLLRGRRR